MSLATIKGFWRHATYGGVYAIKSTPFGNLIGGVGPLDPDDLHDLDSYEYTTKINDWLQRALDNHEMYRVVVK